MNTDLITSLRDDAGLQEKVRRASPERGHRQLFEQRVSFVFGSLGKGNHVTKQKVREVLEQPGGPTAEK